MGFFKKVWKATKKVANLPNKIVHKTGDAVFGSTDSGGGGTSDVSSAPEIGMIVGQDVSEGKENSESIAKRRRKAGKRALKVDTTTTFTSTGANRGV